MKLKRRKRLEVHRLSLEEGRLKLLLSLIKLNEVSEEDKKKIQIKLAIAGEKFEW